MDEKYKQMLMRWSANMLVSEVASAGMYYEACKHEDGRNAESTKKAREEREFVVTLLKSKIDELERLAEIGRKATELVSTITGKEL